MARGFGLGGGSAMVGGNALPSEVLFGKSGYVDGKKVEGSMPNIGQVISYLTTVAQEVVPSEGYHDGTGYVEIAPTEQAKIISSNIRKDVTILGVTGNLQEGVDTSDATATASDILSGKTTYKNGSKITGNIQSVAAKTVTPSTSSQTAVSSGNYCSGTITVGAIPNQQNGGTWTPSTSSQTMVAANKYLKTAVSVNAIPNQGAGGAKYATTSAQTLVTAPQYLTSNLTLGALSQSNLASDNILRGKTITISNGSTNVWSVSGSNSVLKYTSGTATSGTSKTALYYIPSGGSASSVDMSFISINPGFTPVIAISITTGNVIVKTAVADGYIWLYMAGVASYNGRLNDSRNSPWRFQSNAVDLPSVLGTGGNTTYWIFGY